MKAKTIYTFKALVGALLLYWLLSSGRFDISVMKKLSNPMGLTFLIMIYLLILINNNTRWFLILKCYNSKVTWLQCFKLTFIGLFFNFFVPAGSLGGDVVKGYYLAKGSNNKTNLVASVLLDRYFGFCSMLFVSLTVFLINFNTFSNALGVVVLVSIFFLLALSFFLVVRNSRSIKLHNFILTKFKKLTWLTTFHNSFSTVLKNNGLVILSFFISVGSLMLYVLFFALSGKIIGYDENFLVYLYAVPLTLAVTSIPISPGGVGVGQVASLVFFSITSDDPNLGPASISTYQAIGILLSLVGLISYIKLKD